MNKNIQRLQQQNNVPRSAATTIKRKRGNGNGSKLQQGAKTAKALRESEAKYRTLFEFANDAIFLADTQTGKILDVNAAGCNLLGLPKEKITGMHQSELHPPELAGKYKQLFQKHVQKGIVIDENIIIQKADGTHIPVDISTGLIKLGDKTVIQGIFRDVSERLRLAKALSESEERLSKAFRALPEAVSIATLKDGVFLEVNDSFLALNGYSREEVIGHNGKELNIWVNPKDRYRIKQLIEKQGHFENEEFLLRRKSGEARTVVLSADIINFEGEPCILTIGNDVTERKRVEEALKESEEKFHGIVEHVNDGVAFIQNGMLQYCNSKLQEIVGYTEKEVLGQPFLNYIAPEHKGKALDFYKKRIAGEKVPDSYELNLLGKGGRKIYTETSASLINLKQNKIDIAIVRDITKRKEIEQALIDEATRRRILIEQSRDGIVILDQDGNVFETNQKFADMLGYTPEEVRHLHVSDWEFQLPREKVTEMIRTVDEKGDHFETQHRRKDGSIYDVEISTNGAIFAGQKLVFCVCRDITERKRMEQALRESEEKFSKAFHASPQQIIITRDRDDVTIDVNGSFTRVTGFTREETIGKTSKELGVWPKSEDNSRLQQILKDNGRITNEEFEFINKDGEKTTSLVYIEPITIGGEKCWLSILTDISERKKMEEALRESEEKFSKAFHGMPEEVAISRIKDHVFIDVNDTFCRNNGYTREEIIGQSGSELNLTISNNQLNQVMEMINERGRADNIEFEVVKKTGEKQTLLVSADVINISGEPCLLCIAGDITERKRAEEALRESEEKFSKAFHAMPEAVTISRIKDGVFIDINDAFCRDNGCTREEAIGHTGEELNLLLGPGYREEVVKLVKERGRVTNKEFEVKNKYGETQALLFSADIVNIGGEPCLLSIRSDITERKKMENALKESEEKFSKAFHTMPEEVSISRMKDGVFIDANDNFCLANEHTREELIGHSGGELINWAHPGQREQIWQMVNKQGRVQNIEVEFRKKSGEIHTVLFSAGTISIGGEPCILSITSDITERKKMEEALKESEEKFSKVFRGSPELIAVSRRDNNTYIDVNDSFLKTTGYTREELIGHSVYEINMFANPEEQQKMAKAVTKNGYIKNEEYSFRMKNGEIRYWLCSSDTVSINGIPCSVASAIDITERKKIEEALRESEEKFSKAFHAMPEAVSISRIKDGVFIDVNENFCRDNGYTREEVIGRSNEELYLSKEPSKRNQVIKMLKEGRRVENVEFVFTKKTGVAQTVLYSADIITLGGEPCLLSIASDITERKIAEQNLHKALLDLEQSSALLKATNKELESFSYSVSHDLRSPLRSIDGFSQALLEDYTSRLDEKGQDYLQRLRTASQKMGELIDGLLKLSRLTRSEMHQEKVDLSSLANEIAARLQETYKTRVVKFIIGNDLTATGDPQMLRVLLENLLGNAFKFTKNTKQARIEFGSVVDGARKTFFIKDNGAGFDMAFKDKLFGAFQRLHDSAEFPGTGIGLATVQRIINRHGGSIRAEGEVGKGATFYFTLN